MDTNKWLIPASIVLAGIFIGGAVIWNGTHASPGTTAAGTTPTVAVNIKDVDTSDTPYIGQADAPVTIAFWSDYQCPFCKAFETGGVAQIQTPPALPDIIKDYVDAGKVKVVFFDYPFLGNDSVTDAEYGRAIWKLYPEKYFDWRTAMYNAQDEEGDQGFGNAATVDKLDATIPGIDAAKVTADVAANKAAYDAAIKASQAQGQKFGVQATPSFVIGTQLIQGAYPYDNFKQAIDAELAAK